MLFVTVWGSALVGHYAAEKISSSLPALSCAYDQADGAYCVLIPLQHQMHHRVGEMIQQTGQFALTMLLPLAFTFLAFYVFYFFLGKAFCGWVCPLGTIQERLHRLGRLLRRPFHHLSEPAVRRMRPVKWLLLPGLSLASCDHTPHRRRRTGGDPHGRRPRFRPRCAGQHPVRFCPDRQSGGTPAVLSHLPAAGGECRLPASVTDAPGEAAA